MSDDEVQGVMKATLGRMVHPPLIVLKPFPLVVPVEVVEEFVAAVRALDRGRNLEERPAQQQHSLDQPHDVRCAEIQAVLLGLKAQHQGQQAPP
jgi:hypothetical protein